MPSEKHINKRNQIINSTMTLMQRVGYEETNVRTICEAANISIGTFYHYFKDKSELLNMILRQIDIYLDSEVTPLLTSASDEENLRTFALGFARETTASRNFYGGVLSSPNIPLPSIGTDLEDEHNRTLYTLPKQILQHGQETGEFSSRYDAEDLTDKLVTCLRGCSMDWARRNYSYDIEKYIDSFMDIFCSAILTR